MSRSTVKGTSRTLRTGKEARNISLRSVTLGVNQADEECEKIPCIPASRPTGGEGKAAYPNKKGLTSKPRIKRKE